MLMKEIKKAKLDLDVKDLYQYKFWMESQWCYVYFESRAEAEAFVKFTSKKGKRV
jgi:hypothetical protein